MPLTSRILASAPGWRVDDVVCTSGPHDRPFEERHDWACIALVTAGTFHYRSPHGSALLAPGSILLGNAQQCFECSHEHGVGDRCLSFHFAPEFLDGIVATVPGTRRLGFALPQLPPLAPLLPIVAAAEVARDDADEAALEELSLRLVGAVAALLADSHSRGPSPSWRDARRITAALRRIESEAGEPLSLAALARSAAMSRYHFLRTFRAVVGITPYQFLLYTRMQRAAVRLRRSSESIAAIALSEGFGDLSTFNRRFRQLMGVPPSAYRSACLRSG